MVIHCKSVSNCSSEQLTRTFAVLVESRRTDKHTPMLRLPELLRSVKESLRTLRTINSIVETVL